MATKAKYHYLQYHAQRMVKLALYHGDLVRSNTCSYCQSSECVTNAHHEDYSKPLDVIWLCPTCHYNIHRHDKQFEPRAVKAADRVLQHLKSNPSAINKNPFELARTLNVGKSTVYAVIKEMKGQG